MPEPKRLDPFDQAVAATIRRHGMVARGERVLAAVSGGGDSVALLLALLGLRRELGIEVACGHVDHGLHAESLAHAHFVEALCVERAVPFGLARAEVRARAEREDLSLEHAARLERYEALERLAEELGAARIATGHTADDQAETVLLQLLRGTGTRGLSGIAPRLGRVVRPMLEVTRSEARARVLRAACRWVEDPTNCEMGPLRNRVRAELLPFVDQMLGRPCAPTLARAAEALRRERAALEAAEEAFLGRARTGSMATAEDEALSVRMLREMGDAAASLALRRAHRELTGGGEDLSLAHVDEVLGLLTSDTGGGVQRCAGCEFRREGAVLRVRRIGDRGK